MKDGQVPDKKYTHMDFRIAEMFTQFNGVPSKDKLDSGQNFCDDNAMESMHREPATLPVSPDTAARVASQPFTSNRNLSTETATAVDQVRPNRCISYMTPNQVDSHTATPKIYTSNAASQLFTSNRDLSYGDSTQPVPDTASSELYTATTTSQSFRSNRGVIYKTSTRPESYTATSELYPATTASPPTVPNVNLSYGSSTQPSLYTTTPEFYAATTVTQPSTFTTTFDMSTVVGKNDEYLATSCSYCKDTIPQHDHQWMQIEHFVSCMKMHVTKCFDSLQQWHNQRLEEMEKRLMNRLDEPVTMRNEQNIVREFERAHFCEKPSYLPLCTMEAFRDFEADEVKQRNLRRYLISVGGMTTRDALNQFLKEAMADHLVRQFTWTGRAMQGHEPLQPLFDTQMGRVFFNALTDCKNLPPVSRTQFAHHMQDVLRIAKQRGRDAQRRNERHGVRQRYMKEMAQRYPDTNDGD